MLYAFKCFIFSRVPELDELCTTLDLTDKDLFDALRVYLQDAISAWREEQVTEKLGELAKELRVISVFKSEIGADVKTYRAIQNTLNNVFEHMKIPGTVVESLPYSWIQTLKLMRQLSKTPWSDIPDKETVGISLQSNAKKAWENLTQPKLLLEAVLNARNINYTDDELDWIYTNLKPQTYEIPAATFEANLNRLLESISYNRNTALVRNLWKSKSGTSTVREWCNAANIPITWLFDGSDAAAIRTVKALQDGMQVDKTALQNALTFLQNTELAMLSDIQKITDRFLPILVKGIVLRLMQTEKY